MFYWYMTYNWQDGTEPITSAKKASTNNRSEVCLPKYSPHEELLRYRKEKKEEPLKRPSFSF